MQEVKNPYVAQEKRVGRSAGCTPKSRGYAPMHYTSELMYSRNSIYYEMKAVLCLSVTWAPGLCLPISSTTVECGALPRVHCFGCICPYLVIPGMFQSDSTSTYLRLIKDLHIIYSTSMHLGLQIVEW